MGHTPETRARAEIKRKAKRDSWFATNGPCKDCGSWKELELDHIDPELKIGHNVWTWSEVRRTEELAKCQVLCKECHQKKSAAYLRVNEVIHGSYKAYVTTKCRCDICLVWKKNENKKRYDPSRGWNLTKGSMVHIGPLNMTRNPNNRFTSEQVLEIRHKYVSGAYTITELSLEYKVKFDSISKICNYKSYKFVK